MKKYCVDLEIAKELKENGFPQESYFKWYEYTFVGKKSTVVMPKHDDDRDIEICSSPTSDELLKELPAELRINGTLGYLDILVYPDFYTVRYYLVGNLDNIEFSEMKLSNPLAKCWLYLKKEGYIK